MGCDGAFSVGATAADAPPAIAKDTPAAPHTGKAVLERFRLEACFARAMPNLLSVSKYSMGRYVSTFLDRLLHGKPHRSA